MAQEPTLIWKARNPIQQHTQRRRAEATMSLLEPHNQDSILDVGCGEGYQLSFIYRHSPNIVGLDISIFRLKEGKRRLKEVEFIRASCEKLPFRPESFNKAMCLELLEHMADPSIVLSEISVVLMKEGILIVSVPYREQIVMTQCIHCGRLTPHYGHLHSFNEEKISDFLRDYVLLRRQYTCTTIASHFLLSPLPHKFWRILDRLLHLLPNSQPAWVISKVQKPP